MDQFENKDPEIHFRELSHLRQKSTPTTYITEFHKMGAMVTEVSKWRLEMLFMKGLTKICNTEKDESWDDKIPSILWAYRTTYRISIG